MILSNDFYVSYLEKKNFNYYEILISKVLPIFISYIKILHLNSSSIDENFKKQKILNNFSEIFINLFNNKKNEFKKINENYTIIEEFSQFYEGIIFNFSFSTQIYDDDENENDFKNIIRIIPLKNIKNIKGPQSDLYKIFISNILFNKTLKSKVIEPENIFFINLIKNIETFKSENLILTNLTFEKLINKIVSTIRILEEKCENSEIMGYSIELLSFI